VSVTVVPKSLSDLYIDELRDLHDAESRLVNALPEMIQAASNVDLKQALVNDLDQAKRHLERIETICDDLGETPEGRRCAGMLGILDEVNAIIDTDTIPSIIDAGLAAEAQHVEQYEIASYGALSSWGDHLGFRSHVALLKQTLSEKRQSDQALSDIAERLLNPEAAKEEITASRLADIVPAKTRPTAQAKRLDNEDRPDAT